MIACEFLPPWSVVFIEHQCIDGTRARWLILSRNGQLEAQFRVAEYDSEKACIIAAWCHAYWSPAATRRIWLAEVARWHHSTVPALRRSGDGIQAHQCRVAQLLDMIFPDWTREEMREALYHDTPESWTGDPSYEAKQCPQIKAAHDWAEADTALRLGIPPTCSPRVKVCDGIDCIMWAQLHAPHVMGGDGWPEHIKVVQAAADKLGVGDVVRALLHQP